jgi:DNA-directed RNA polymerase specialized sigma24 family protein
MRRDGGGIDERFADFVRARGEHLLRVAVLLTGDWHAAEDLVQASLVKLYRAWPQLDTKADPDAYLRRIMVNTHRSWWRARWRRETPMEVLPESGLKGIGPVTLNGEFDPARGVGEETSGTGAQVRFAGGYMYLPLSDAFRAAFEKNRGISIPAGKSWVRFPAPLRSGGEVTLINLTQFGIAPSDLGQVSPLGLLGLLQSVSQVRQTGPASGHGWTGTAYSFTFTKDFGGPLHLVLRVKGTVGVDREGRVRQLDADYSIGKTRQRSEMTFGDFGAPVSVSAPPASEVYIPLSG